MHSIFLKHLTRSIPFSWLVTLKPKLTLELWWSHLNHIYSGPDLPSQHSTVSRHPSSVPVVQHWFWLSQLCDAASLRGFVIKMDSVTLALRLSLSSYLSIWQAEEELSIKASGSSQSTIYGIQPVGGSDHHNLSSADQAIHECQKCWNNRANRKI